MEEFGTTYGPVVFSLIGFPRKISCVFYFLHFYFIGLDCGIIIGCLIGLVIFVHLTTQREKVCVILPLFSTFLYLSLGVVLVCSGLPTISKGCPTFYYFLIDFFSTRFFYIREVHEMSLYLLLVSSFRLFLLIILLFPNFQNK